MEVKMSKQTLRYGIFVLGLITGVIHAVILNLSGLNWLMLLNGLGYFVLTLVVFFDPAFLVGQRKPIIYMFIVYTLITFVGYFVLNFPNYGPLGYIAKIDEVFLLIALWLIKDK
jgi:hypothetical protein